MITSQINISRALQLGGWMSEKELVWLASSARECKTIVEFGSYHGRSTRCLADNIGEDGRIYAVDPWNGEYKTDGGNTLGDVNTFAFPAFKNNLRDKISDGTVIPIRAYSQNFKLPFQVDMVFIDGDHRSEAIKKDIEKAEELVKPGGIISGHDYGHSLWYSVKDVVDVTYGPNVKIEDTIWWIVKS